MGCNYLQKSLCLLGIFIFFAASENSEGFVNFTNDGSNVARLMSEDYNQGGVCGSYQLDPTRILRIQSPKTYDNDTAEYECSWVINGQSSECKPQIMCENFNLAESTGCSSNFLELSDGTEAKTRFCGTDAPNVASSTSTLIAYFKTDALNYNKGFRCSVVCAPLTQLASGNNAVPNLVKKAETCSGTPKFLPASLKKSDQRVVGGQNATEGQFPYQVNLRNQSAYFCGGSIISSMYILTAAHCLQDMKVEDVSVRVGTTKLFGAPSTTYIASKLIIHSKYNKGKFSDDIALVKVKGPIYGSQKVQTVPLATTTTPDGTAATLTGWGLQNATSQYVPNDLNYVQLKTITVEKCKTELGSGYSVLESNVCTQVPKGKGSCEGDSGGPLVANGVQIGVVSYGIPCGTGAPDVFSSVAYYHPWILKHSDVGC